MERELLARGKARRSKLAVLLERDGEGIFHVALRGPGPWNECRGHDFSFPDERDAREVWSNFVEDREPTPEEKAKWDDVFVLAAAALERMAPKNAPMGRTDVLERWEAPDGHRGAMLVRREFLDGVHWEVPVAHRQYGGALVWHNDGRDFYREDTARAEFRRIVEARL